MMDMPLSKLRSTIYCGLLKIYFFNLDNLDQAVFIELLFNLQCNIRLFLIFTEY
jgi:hypothetical protein